MEDNNNNNNVPTWRKYMEQEDFDMNKLSDKELEELISAMTPHEEKPLEEVIMHKDKVNPSDVKKPGNLVIKYPNFTPQEIVTPFVAEFAAKEAVEYFEDIRDGRIEPPTISNWQHYDHDNIPKVLLDAFTAPMKITIPNKFDPIMEPVKKVSMIEPVLVTLLNRGPTAVIYGSIADTHRVKQSTPAIFFDCADKTEKDTRCRSADHTYETIGEDETDMGDIIGTWFDSMNDKGAFYVHFGFDFFNKKVRCEDDLEFISTLIHILREIMCRDPISSARQKIKLTFVQHIPDYINPKSTCQTLEVIDGKGDGSFPLVMCNVNDRPVTAAFVALKHFQKIADSDSVICYAESPVSYGGTHGSQHSFQIITLEINATSHATYPCCTDMPGDKVYLIPRKLTDHREEEWAIKIRNVNYRSAVPLEVEDLTKQDWATMLSAPKWDGRNIALILEFSRDRLDCAIGYDRAGHFFDVADEKGDRITLVPSNWDYPDTELYSETVILFTEYVNGRFIAFDMLCDYSFGKRLTILQDVVRKAKVSWLVSQHYRPFYQCPGMWQQGYADPTDGIIFQSSTALHAEPARSWKKKYTIEVQAKFARSAPLGDPERIVEVNFGDLIYVRERFDRITPSTLESILSVGKSKPTIHGIETYQHLKFKTDPVLDIALFCGSYETVDTHMDKIFSTYPSPLKWTGVKPESLYKVLVRRYAKFRSASFAVFDLVSFAEGFSQVVSMTQRLEQLSNGQNSSKRSESEEINPSKVKAARAGPFDNDHD